MTETKEEINVTETKDKIENEPVVKQKDAALLRECLALCARTAPPAMKQKIHLTFMEYAKAMQEYCVCPQRIYIDKEKKHACLDCGKRHDVGIEKPEKKTEVYVAKVKKPLLDIEDKPTPLQVKPLSKAVIKKGKKLVKALTKNVSKKTTKKKRTKRNG